MSSFFLQIDEDEDPNYQRSIYQMKKKKSNNFRVAPQQNEKKKVLAIKGTQFSNF